MNRFWLWGLGALVAGLAYWAWEPDFTNPPTEDVVVVDPEEIKDEAHVTASVSPALNSPLSTSMGKIEPIHPGSAQQKIVDRYPPSLTETQVYFEVIEGDLAITGGDIILGKLPEENKGIKNGVFEPPRTSLWPSPEIPFVIATDVRNPTPIFEAIEYFKTHTPVRFVPAEEDDQDMIVFVATSEHCASHLGRVGGPQPILVSEFCGKSEILHELMHALGFVHEHARLDRDRHVKVLWENIKEESYPQFNKMPDQLVHEYTGSVFDFDSESIMLYSETAFAKAPGLKSLESKVGRSLNPVREELSRLDRERVFYLYGR